MALRVARQLLFHLTTVTRHPFNLPIRPVSDEFWAAIEPLLPTPARAEGQTFHRRPGGGRKPIPARSAFEAMVHVLRTGIPWKDLPKPLGSPSAIHRRFDLWHASGLFSRIWESGLAERDELEGVPWEWHRETSLNMPGTNLTEPHPTTTTDVAKPVRLWQPSLIRRRQRKGRTH